MAPVWVLPAVILMTLGVSLSSQLINHKMTSQDFIKTKRKEMNDLQKKLTPATPKAELDAIQAKIMSLNSELMKHTMKPTMYTFIPLLAVFYIMNAFFTPYGDLISFGETSVPLFGTGMSWLGTYFVSSMIFSFTLKPLITKVDEYVKKKKEDE